MSLEKRLEIEPLVCSYYDELRALYDARNAALHGAEPDFTDKLPSQSEFMVERVLLEALGWVTRSGAKTMDEYEAAIAALPVA